MTQLSEKAAEKLHWQRWCALVGIALAISSVLVANLRPVAPGDMSVFTYALVAFAQLVAGGLLILIALAGWFVAAIRRRTRSPHAAA